MKQSPKPRIQTESDNSSATTKTGLAGKLEEAMRVIFFRHQPENLRLAPRSGWRRIFARVEAAMKERGLSSCKPKSAIQRFIKGYAGCSMPLPVVIGLADALGLSGKTHATFVLYGAMLRGREDTRAVLYQYLVAAGTIPAIEDIGRLWEKRP